jgi:hypothetical protein
MRIIKLYIRKNLLGVIIVLSISQLNIEESVAQNHNNPVVRVKENQTFNNNLLKSKYSAQERLGVDFEIKNNKNPSVELLNKLDLYNIEKYREEDSSVEIIDPSSGVTIILYSINEALKKEAESKHFIDYIRILYFHEN